MKRQLHPDATYGTQSSRVLTFSFVANGTSAPTITTSAAGTNYRGDGLLPLATPGSVAVTHTATGKFTVVLCPDDTSRYIVTGSATLWDSSSGDGGWATMAAPTQGEGDGKALTFIVFTWQNSSGTNTLTDFTSRRVSVELTLKDSLVGG